ncbi:MAG: phytoene/squalene synthase family protein [Cytophagales bacterium]|nr:phytoene/squalene synthase family protein [Cytophagales bacterium]
MKILFDQISQICSKRTTETYSTSFSLGIRFLSSEIQQAIYAIYGFVRFADEIVDSFQGYPQEKLLKKFWQDTHDAIHDRISLNPILNNFQETVLSHGIEKKLIDEFMRSMEADLYKTRYEKQEEYASYIFGSAEAVGLMCLKVFCKGNESQYQKLAPQARRLGAAFQKVNFLRDIRDDHERLGRFYFPNLNWEHFNDKAKKNIEDDIQQDFDEALQGIRRLPKNSRFGVYLAYTYYKHLFRKIRKTKARKVMKKRVRVPNPTKFLLFFNSYIKHQVNIL